MNWRTENWMGVVAILFVVVVIALIVLGIREEGRTTVFTDWSSTETKICINDHGQTLVNVKFTSLAAWMEANKDARIVSICPIDREGYGRTSSFLILFERKAEKEKGEPR